MKRLAIAVWFMIWKNCRFSFVTYVLYDNIKSKEQQQQKKMINYMFHVILIDNIGLLQSKQTSAPTTQPSIVIDQAFSIDNC